jgi:cytochrome c2
LLTLKSSQFAILFCAHWHSHPFTVEVGPEFAILKTTAIPSNSRNRFMINKIKLSLIAGTIALIATTSAFAGGDIKKGKKVFRKCKSCHMVGEKAKRKVGPVLNNIFGATAGKNEEFEKKYSKNMKKAGEEGLVWDEATLTEYLTKPKAMIKKTKMAFKGLKKPKDIENILVYLLQFSPDYDASKKDDAGEDTTKAE